MTPLAEYEAIIGVDAAWREVPCSFDEFVTGRSHLRLGPLYPRQRTAMLELIGSDAQRIFEDPYDLDPGQVARLDHWNSAFTIQRMRQKRMNVEDEQWSRPFQVDVYRKLRSQFYNSLVSLPDTPSITSKDGMSPGAIYELERLEFIDGDTAGRCGASARRPARSGARRVSTAVLLRDRWRASRGLTSSARIPPIIQHTKEAPLALSNEGLGNRPGSCGRLPVCAHVTLI